MHADEGPGSLCFASGCIGVGTVQRVHSDMSILANARAFMPFLNAQRSEEQEGGSPSPGAQRFAAGSSSPRAAARGPQRGRPTSGMAPLVVPGDQELFIDTGPPTDSQSFSLASPSPAAREIRARPIDVEKEIPLLFVDDVEPPTPGADGAGPSSSGGGLSGLPVSRQNSCSGLASALTSTQSPMLSSSLAVNLSGLSSSVVPQAIHIPQCVKIPNWEAPPVARRFRLPTKLLVYRPQPGLERVAEYELDDEDLEWLAQLNVGQRQPLLDEEQMEEAIDKLEKASFRVLHGATHAERALNAPPTMPLPLNGHPAPLPLRAPAAPLSPGRNGAATGRRKEAKRASSSMPSPQRSPKQPKQPKPDRPPPPSDTELLHLPAGLCRRYQQGRCHKGRSCKWKHEVWPELQLRWENWQSGAASGGGGSGGTERTTAKAAAKAANAAKAAADAAAAAAHAAAAAVAAFPPPTTSGGTAGQQFKALDLLPPKDEDDPLGELALSSLGVQSALELVPPSLVPPGMKEREAAARSHQLSLMGGGGLAIPGVGSADVVPADAEADAEADAMLEEIVGPPATAGGGSPTASSTLQALAPSLAASAAGAADGDETKSNAEASAYGEMLSLVEGDDANIASELANEEHFPSIAADSPTVRVSLAGASTADAPSGDNGKRNDNGKARAADPHAASSYDPDGLAEADEGDELEGTSSALVPAGGGAMTEGQPGSSSLSAEGGEGNDYGVPRASLRDLLRGITGRVQNGLYDWWLDKRRKDVSSCLARARARSPKRTRTRRSPPRARQASETPSAVHADRLCACGRVLVRQPEQLPILSRLRQEAAQMRARQAHSSTALTDVVGLRDELIRMRRLLTLIKRREKLKAQIAQLHQAHFEMLAKERKAAGGFPSATQSPGLLPHTESCSSLYGVEGSAGGSPASKREGKRPKLEEAPSEPFESAGLPSAGLPSADLPSADLPSAEMTSPALEMKAEGGGGGEGSADGTNHRRSGRAANAREKFEP